MPLHVDTTTARGSVERQLQITGKVMTRLAKRTLKMDIMMMVVVSILIIMLCLAGKLEAFDMDEEKIIQKASLALVESRLQQEEDIRAFVSFASIAALESYKGETRLCAEWLREFLKSRLGMTDASLYESGYRNPVVGSSG